jgi:MFS family permease
VAGAIQSNPLPALDAPAPAASLSDIRTLGPWYAVEFLNSFACTLLCTGCYDFADKQLHVTASVELWLSAFWGLSYVPIALLAGRLSERWGPRRSVVSMSFGCVLTSLAGLAVIAFPSVWLLLLVMLPYNFTSTTIWPAVESALTRTRGKMRLSARMALYNISWGSAGFVALFVRGALEHWSWSTIFVVPAVASLLGWLLLAVLGVPASMIGREHVADSADAGADSPELQRRARTLLHMAWIGNALAYVAINVLIPLLAKLAELAHNGDLIGGGMITSIWSFTRFAGFGLVWIWAGWHYKARWLLTAQGVLAVTFCMMLTIHQAGALMALQVVFGLATALIYSSALYYAMHVSSGHGGHAGMHEALIGMGIAVGPTIGAVAGTGEMGVAAMQRIAVGVTGLLLAGTLVMAWMARRGGSAINSVTSKE